MPHVTLDQVLRLAEQLSPPERVLLIAHLQEMPSEARGLTLADIQAEHERRRASGEFGRTISLMGKYANPDLDWSFDALQSSIHQSATEWEQELGEFSDDSD